MKIIFDQEYLEQLYLYGRTSDKKHRFQPQVIAKYRKTIDLMESLQLIEDFYRFHSLNYEMLTGDYGAQNEAFIDEVGGFELKPLSLWQLGKGRGVRPKKRSVYIGLISV